MLCQDQHLAVNRKQTSIQQSFAIMTHYEKSSKCHKDRGHRNFFVVGDNAYEYSEQQKGLCRYD